MCEGVKESQQMGWLPEQLTLNPNPSAGRPVGTIQQVAASV